MTTDGNQLDLSESGQLQLSDTQSVEFANQYRFELQNASTMLLSHLRHGRKNPVYLLRLDKHDHHDWRCVSPHYCGDDVYQARLCLSSDQMASADNCVQLHWLIQGTHKNVKMSVSYWCDKTVMDYII